MNIIKLEVDEIDLNFMKAGAAPVVKVVPMDDDNILFMTAVVVRKVDAGKAWKKLSAVQTEKV